MTEYPMLRFKSKQTTTITEFKGINHTLSCGLGEWWEVRNMSTEQYPMAGTAGDRAAMINPGGFPVPANDVVAVCQTTPPTWLDSLGYLWCGGNSVRLYTEASVRWYGQIKTGVDARAGDATYTISPEGAAQIASDLELTAPDGAVLFGICVDEDAQPALWSIRRGLDEYIYEDVTLDSVGITRHSEIGVEALGDTISISIMHTWINTLTGPRQMVDMGGKVVIWPDKWFCNVVKLASGDRMVDGVDYGSLELHNTVTPSGEAPVYCYLCDRDGNPYINETAQIEPGATPFATRVEGGNVWYGAKTPDSGDSVAHDVTEGDLWLQLQGVDGQDYIASIYSEAMGWIPTDNVYVKLWATGIGVGLKPGYQIKIDGYTGMSKEYRRHINGEHTVVDCSDDYIIIKGFANTVSNNNQTSGSLTLDMAVPDMDYVVECGNRLWGCYYGEDESGVMLNELYACALGDFRSWRQYEGTSMDSWTASRGSDGPWTGAAVLGGNPLFFKEKCLEKISPASSGAHQVQTISLDGVMRGCGKSLAVINNAVFYKGRDGVYVYRGQLPQRISYKLGPEAEQGRLATAGRSGSRYVIDMEVGGKRRLFVFDTETGLWMEEDQIVGYTCEAETDLPVFVTLNNELVYIDTGRGNAMYMRRNDRLHSDYMGAKWFAETGNLGLETGKRKYFSRIRIRFALPFMRSHIRVSVSYDDGRTWEIKGGASRGVGAVQTLNIFPRRCDRIRLRFDGMHGCQIQLIEFNTETGSDV